MCLYMLHVSRTLVVEELPPANLDFVQAHGIRLVQIGVEGNKVGSHYGWDHARRSIKR